MGVIEFIREELQLWCLAGARGVSHVLALGSSDSLCHVHGCMQGCSQGSAWPSTARGGWWLKGPMSLKLLIGIKEKLKGPQV